jgi:transposase-like protein
LRCAATYRHPKAHHLCPARPGQVREQLGIIAGMLGRQFPKVAAMLVDAANDITAFAVFPIGHWKKIWSTNRWRD